MLNTIYIIRNKINDKVYVGQTWRPLSKRWCYGHGYRGCIKLENAIKKYGKHNFYYEILTLCGTQESADYWETYFINRYDSVNNGYNISLVGTKAPMTGRKHSRRSRLAISESRKGRFSGENNPFYGKHHSAETISKLSQISIGNCNFLGRKHTDESKTKISEAGKGQHRSSETEFKRGKKWEPNSATKLNLEIAENIRQDHVNGLSGIVISEKYGISRANVSRIINNKMWVK